MSLKDSLRNSDKIIVIVGPTGSGKTSISIEIAKKIGGEIISADSRAIYKYMDIGTAKPSVTEMDGVVHYGFDLVKPSDRFTVADWKDYAEQKICSIVQSGKIPIIVGGTGLYIDALVFDYKFTQEAKENYSDRGEIDSRFKIFGIKTEMDDLKIRLTKRADKMFVQDLFNETSFLVEKFGWGNQAMKSNIYQFAWKYMNGEICLEEAKRLLVLDDWHLAKRQMTWFKRNKDIVWLPLEKIESAVLKCIQNEQRK